MLSRTTLLWVNRLLWFVLVGAVLLLGSLVTLGRNYIPYVEGHRQQLVDMFNQRTGLQLSIGHLSGQWQRLSPHFIIDDLRLYNPKQPDQVVLQLDHAELQLGLFRSINARTVAISRLQGRGMRVQLEEAPLGQWHLPGFEPQGPANIDAVLDLLLAIYRAHLSDTRIDLRFAGGSEAHLLSPALDVQRAGDFRRVNLALALADKAAPFTLVVEAHGDPRDRSFGARGHTALHALDLAPVLPVARAFGVNLQQGRIDATVWLDWRAGGVIEVCGSASLPQLDIAAFSATELPPVTDIKTEFFLRDEAGRRQLWLPQLSGSWSGTRLDFQQLQLSVDSEHPDLYRLALPALALAPLRDAVLASNTLAPATRDHIAALAPTGTLRNLQLELPLKPEQHAQMRLRAQLDQLAVQPWEGAPGAEGVSGYIDAGLQGGVVDLASDGFAMAFPHVYHQPLHFDRVRGQIGWQIAGEHVLVNSGPIPVEGDAGRATAQFALDLPMHHGGGTPLMTLMVGLRNSAAQYRDRFIPYTLEPALLDWLGYSVRGGKIPLGGFIYRGSLVGHEHLEHTVQLFLDVRDGELAYQPDWPPLHDLRAGVWVDDGDLLVEAPTARVFDHIAVHDVSVELHHPESGSWLTVQGAADGEDDDVLRLLRESPLHKHIGSALDAWSWRGSVQSQLDFGIPLSGSRPMQINVDSELGPGTLALADQRIVVTEVHGPLNYSSDAGLQSQAIGGKWYGKPLAIKVSTESSGEMGVQASGRIGMADLKDWLRQPLFDYADGDTPFVATLHIAGERSSVAVHSDLVGATLDLPPPYRKTAAEKLPLAVHMSLGSQRELLAELSDWADLRLRWDSGLQIDAAVLRLGQTGKTAFASQQMVVTGRVPSLDFNAWRDILARDRGGVERSAKPDEDALALSLRDIQFDTITVGGQTLDGLVLSGHREAEAWQLAVSAQQVAGSLRVPDQAQQPWAAKLTYLRLPAPAAEPKPELTSTPAQDSQRSALADIDPAALLPIDLSIEHLWRGSEELGALTMQLRHVDAGVRLDHLSGHLREVTLAPRGEQPASLIWTRRDGVDHSEFSANLVVDDAAKALQRWRYEPVLTSKRGEIALALQWPGAPDQFQFKRAQGDATLHIDDGRFLKASTSTTGALKVVGIFNFANFLKRLQLDFSDVFKDGVSFDDLRGSVAAQQGVLKTVEPVEIKSPSSRFRVAGQIDFNSDRADLELVATLPVASNLPWVVALTGGLPAAAGVYVASKIFQNQVDKFASATYDITGPWADPKVKLRSVFDDKLQQKTADKSEKRAPKEAP